MIEIYSEFVLDWCRRVMKSALPSDKEVRVVYSHSPTLDAQLVKKRFQSQSTEHTKSLVPFAAVQQTPPPEPLPRAHPNQPGFVVAKRYQKVGKFLGTVATLAKVPYQIRFYMESEPQRFGVVEAILINNPRFTSYGKATIWFLEEASVVVSYTIESVDYFREIDASTFDQMPLHTVLVSMYLEVPIFAEKTYAGPLLLRPIIFYDFGDVGEVIRVEYDDGG